MKLGNKVTYMYILTPNFSNPTNIFFSSYNMRKINDMKN